MAALTLKGKKWWGENLSQHLPESRELGKAKTERKGVEVVLGLVRNAASEL